MEALPRPPMLSFELKNSTEATSFIKLKKYIGECYHEDPDTYSSEINALETLRNSAMRPVFDISGCLVLRRYYAQLHSLQGRFPDISEKQLLSFTWTDVHSDLIYSSTDLKYEMACVLYNFGCLHSKLGASDPRTSSDGMKLACTHFQRSAWAFEHLRENYLQHMNVDMIHERLVFMEQLCYAQAQECILEKSLTDNRKPGIVAKITSQIINYYNSALASLLSTGDEGRFAELVENKTVKKWKRYVKFKISYLSAILLLYQGQTSEELQKMGERVVLFQAAFDKLEEAKKESKGMWNLEQVNETLTFLTEIIEAKRKNAKNENEFIYHEEIPDISTVSAIKGANLVNGIGFSVVDPEVLGEDIFHRLVPMKAHEASSLYSEEKANFMRKIATKIEEKDLELNSYMSSLNIDPIIGEQSSKLPQELIDKCADINGKPNAIPDLITSMANLADICVDVETMLQEIRELLQEEKIREKNYQKTTGGRSGVHFGELNREFQKYQEAHSKAGESNETLRKAMGMHVTNLKMLSQPLNELQSQVPTCNEYNENDNVKLLRTLLSKVKEMQNQRASLYETLRNDIINDDITSQIVVYGDKKLDKLFKKELSKHDKNVALLEQNLTAQSNILKALTDAYASSAALIKSIVETKHKRDQFFSSLTSSYDVYEDLLGKSAKGLEFYKKLQTNIQKLLARVRAARVVQDEERQQRLTTTGTGTTIKPSTQSHTPKLKDYMKNNSGESNPSYIPSIRPSPLGSETTGMDNCGMSPMTDMKIPQSINGSGAVEKPPKYVSSLNYTNYTYPSANPVANNEPPPPYYEYAPQQQQQPQQQNVVNTNVSTGYTNPMYQQYYTDESSQNNYMNMYGNYGVSGYAGVGVSSEPAPDYSQQKWDQTVLSTQMSQLSVQNPQQTHPLPTPTPPQSQHQQALSNIPQQPSITTTGTSYQPLQDSTSDDKNYYSSSYGNYHITANKQYITGYDQNSQNQTTPMMSYSEYIQSNVPISTTSSIANQPDLHNLNSYSSHPGFSLNSGEYHYGSGYQINGNIQPNMYYGQYTFAGDNQNLNNQTQSTNSENSSNYMFYGQFQNPQIPVSQPIQQTTGNTIGQSQIQTIDYYGNQYAQQQYQPPNQVMDQMGQITQVQNVPVDVNSYYTVQGIQNTDHLHQSTFNTLNTISQVPANQITYIHSNNNIETKTTNSSNSVENHPTTIIKSTNDQPVVLSSIENKGGKKSNIDLLSDIDFSNINLPVETLQPEPIKESIEKKVLSVDENVKEVIVSDKEKKTITSSIDELSLCSDLSSLDKNFDVDSTSGVKADAEITSNKASEQSSVIIKNILQEYKTNPFDDGQILKMFHKEVERLERFMETINIKTLNGTTPIDGKWKELQDLLVKDESKRMVSVAKLFPEKNRAEDSVPYNHARVLLPTTTDDYINAAYVRELCLSCPQIIITQTPLQNTLKDYWSMVWSEKSEILICLHTPNELMDPFWPIEINQEQHYGEYTVTLLNQYELSHCIERSIKLTLHGSNTSLNLSVIQIKTWIKNSIINILGISNNIVTVYRQRLQEKKSSIILTVNCLTGSERSGIIGVGLATILATQISRPILLNVVDVWYRICSQRKGALCDISTLQLSYQIVLSHAHEILNKRGIMTSYQMKTAQVVKNIDKEETKDPFCELDPLWKLKDKTN